MNVPAFVRSALLGGATVLVLSCGDRSPLGVNARAPTIQGDLLDSLVQTAQQSAGLLRCSPIAADSVTQTIGPAGGALVVGGQTLSVPPGALSDSVSITAVAPSDTLNRVVFQPEGLTFQQPASLTMSYANCSAITAAKRIAYLNASGSILEYLPSVDDPSAQAVTANLSHFSDYAIAW